MVYLRIFMVLLECPITSEGKDLVTKLVEGGVPIKYTLTLKSVQCRVISY